MEGNDYGFLIHGKALGFFLLTSFFCVHNLNVYLQGRSWGTQFSLKSWAAKKSILSDTQQEKQHCEARSELDVGSA